MPSERKVVIVGAGAVGSTFAFPLRRSGLAGVRVLLDLDRERAEGEATDCNHGLFFARTHHTYTLCERRGTPHTKNLVSHQCLHQ